MLAGAKQEGTSDVAYSRNQPSVLEDDREPQRQRGARSGAQHTSNPKRVADFRGSQVCDSRPPRCAGQMTLGTAPIMVLGRHSSTRVQNQRREPLPRQRLQAIFFPEVLAQALHHEGRLDLREAFIDGSFAPAKQGGAAVGKTKRGKGSKIMAIADRQGF